MSYRRIKASEINNYLYCRRSWWLQRTQGHVSQNVRELAAGSAHHQEHGRIVKQSFWARRLAYLLLFIVVALVAYQIVAGW